MQGEIEKVKEILEDYIPPPECERVARRIVQEIVEEQQRKEEPRSEKPQKIFDFVNRCGPGGDVWHPHMCQSGR